MEKNWTAQDAVVVAALEAEVTPPGYEDVVRALKKKGSVDNPWAVAWSMHGSEALAKLRKKRAEAMSSTAMPALQRGGAKRAR